MNTVFLHKPCFENEEWRFAIPDQTEDLSDLYGLALSKEQTERMAEHFLAAWKAEKELIIGAVWRKDGHLKCIHEVYQVRGDACTIGYRCRKSEQGKHYTSASLDAVIGYLRRCGIKKISAACEKQNISSSKILEHNGFMIEKEDCEKIYYSRIF